MQRVEATDYKPRGVLHYSEEYCKVALLLSALLTVPLRDFIAACLMPYVPLSTARGISYGLLGVVFLLFFCVPYLCCLSCKIDMFLLGFWVFGELLLFGFQRPEEISSIYVVLVIKSLFMAFPYYVVARSLKDYALLERSLYPTSFFINILVLIAMRQRVEAEGMYSMGAAYAVLPGAIIAFRMFLRKGSFLAMVNAVVALLVLIFCGTRGSMVCYLSFCVYELIFNYVMIWKKTIRNILAGSLIGLTLVSVYFLPESNLPIEEIREYGLSARILGKVADGTFFVDAPRTRIWQTGWEIVSEYPLTGVGLLEDRLQIFQRGGFYREEAQTRWQGFYSHFIFLDWLIEYGIVVGGIVSLVMVYWSCKIFTMSRCAYKSCWEIIFFSGIIPLFFSGIWHEDRMFYIALGMACSIFKVTKRI